MSKTSIIPEYKRYFFKLIHKIFNQKNNYHNRRYWPYYHVIRRENGSIEKIYFNNQLVCHNQLENLTASQKEVVLVATGPSVKEIMPSFFQDPNKYYMGVNGAISLDHVNFQYYVLIDHNFIQNRLDLVKKIISSQGTLFTTPRCLDEILRRIEFKDIKRKFYIIEKISDLYIERIMQEGLKVNPDHFPRINQINFSDHIDRGVFDYFTVAYCALQICYSIKVKTIYLVGLDMNNFDKPRFYESDATMQNTYLHLHQKQLLDIFDAASIFFIEKQIKVFNLSLNSAVESFEKLDYQKI